MIQFLREGDRRFWSFLVVGIAFAVIMAATGNFGMIGVSGAFIAIDFANRSRSAAEESQQLPRHERPLMIASVSLGVTMLAGTVLFFPVK